MLQNVAGSNAWDMSGFSQSVIEQQQQTNKKKSAADFLGDNASLVNLDNLVVRSTHSPSGAATSKCTVVYANCS